MCAVSGLTLWESNMQRRSSLCFSIVPWSSRMPALSRMPSPLRVRASLSNGMLFRLSGGIGLSVRFMVLH